MHLPELPDWMLKRYRTLRQFCSYSLPPYFIGPQPVRELHRGVTCNKLRITVRKWELFLCESCSCGGEKSISRLSSSRSTLGPNATNGAWPTWVLVSVQSKSAFYTLSTGPSSMEEAVIKLSVLTELCCAAQVSAGCSPSEGQTILSQGLPKTLRKHKYLHDDS